jgi:inorganic pyrophosphatase
MKIIITYLLAIFLFSCNTPGQDYDPTMITSHDFLRDFPAYTSDSLVNIVVEIPAGSNQKWEVNKDTGFMEWERRGDDSLRVVKYLPYPANYGMIPRTWLPEAEGGDNDPLDVFLLGESVERASVVPARIVGVIKMLDKGLQDDKLIAVPVNDWHYSIFTLEDLEEQYPGILEIISMWLMNYKSPGIVELLGVENEIVAHDILNRFIKAYDLSGGIIAGGND